VFHKFLNFFRKNLVVALTKFASRQFLERIVTANETWVYHYEPENKAQSTVWKCPTSLMAKKFKSEPSSGKIMLTLFGDMEGGILVHFTPKGKIIKSDFLMYGPMKEALRGRRSTSGEDVIGAVQNWLKKQQKNFFRRN
jgi:hypothetical protein